MYQWARISITQLINPVDTSSQDEQRRRTQESHEHLEFSWQCALVNLRIRRFVVPSREFERKANEDTYCEDLEREAREGDVDRPLTVARGLGRRSAAHCLQDEGENIAGDENPIVELCGEARILLAEVADAMSISVCPVRKEEVTNVLASVK